MRHQYTYVTHLSWGDKLQRSWQSVGGGFIFIASAISILHWNETRVNMAILAHESVEANNVAATQGRLVSVTGAILTNSPLGDDRFLRPGNYVVADRTVEMYSWTETAETQQRKKHLGGIGN